VVDVDFFNPITNNLQFSWSAATSLINSVNKKSLTDINGPTVYADSLGRIKNFIKTSSQYTDCGTGSDVDFTNKSITVFLRYKISTTGSGVGHSLFSKDDNTGGRSYTLENFYYTGTPSRSGTRFYANGGGTLGTNEIAEGRTPVAGDVRTCCVVYSPANNRAEVWVEGVLVNSTTCSTAIPTSTTSARLGSRSYVGYQDYLNGGLSFVHAFGRPLSHAEIKELFNNPWQIFKPKKRVIYFDVSSPSFPVLSSLAVSNITSSGGRLTAST
jgi:hypothetical protein